MGEEVLATGDGERALGIFDQLFEMAPDHPQVASGRIRALMAAGLHDEAEAAIAALSPELAKLPEVTRAQATLVLAKTAVPVGDLAALEAKVAAEPENMELRFELANGQVAAGAHDAAADTLLAMVKDDRAWNEGAARTQLLRLFEAVGLMDPGVSQQRRRLSAVLFG